MHAHLFQNPSCYEDLASKFLNSGREFSENLVRSFRQLIDQRYPSPQSAARSQCLALIEATFYTALLDRISVDRLRTLSSVAPAVAAIPAHAGTLFADRCGRAETEFTPAFLLEARDLIANAMVACPFSRMIHFALKAVTFVSVASKRAASIGDALAWGIRQTRDAPQYLVLWGFFVRLFFPEQSQLRDPIGGCDAAQWGSFAELFEEMLKLV
jgi:hypothetical protein